MNLRCIFFLTIFMLWRADLLPAQPSPHTMLDTAGISERRAKKIAVKYGFTQFFDSLTGNPTGKTDTAIYRYDTEGREMMHSHMVSANQRYTLYFFYNNMNRLVRSISSDGDTLSDAHINTWEYNSGGLVVTEHSIRRTDHVDALSCTKTFEYDSLGRLVKETEICRYDKATGKSRVTRFSYDGNMTYELGVYTTGDTNCVDTTWRSGLNTWHRFYLFPSELVAIYPDGTTKSRDVKTLASSFEIHVDTIVRKKKSVKRTVIYYESFLYGLSLERDTVYRTMDDQLIESRSILYMDEYGYDSKGEFAYMMRRNRKGQAIFRYTTSYGYYQ